MEAQYADGIWYDSYNGDYCEIQSGTDGNGNEVVELVEPEAGFVYHEIPLPEWEDYERYDFAPVPQEAVDDPKDFMVEMLDMAQSGEALSDRGRRGLGWARQQVSITAE